MDEIENLFKEFNSKKNAEIPSEHYLKEFASDLNKRKRQEETLLWKNELKSYSFVEKFLYGPECTSFTILRSRIDSLKSENDNKNFILSEIEKQIRMTVNENPFVKLGYDQFIAKGQIKWEKFYLDVLHMMDAAAICCDDHVMKCIKDGNDPTAYTNFKERFNEVADGFFSAYFLSELNVWRDDQSEQTSLDGHQWKTAHLALVLRLLDIPTYLNDKFELKPAESARVLADLFGLPKQDGFKRPISGAFTKKVLTRESYKKAMFFLKEHKLLSLIAELESHASRFGIDKNELE